MRKILGTTVVAIAATLLLGSCGSPQQLGDRGGVDGAPPDKISEVDYAEIYRNVDGFPNLGRFCVDGLGFAAPSTGAAVGEGGTNGATPIIRVPEWDEDCSNRRYTGPIVPPSTTPETPS